MFTELAPGVYSFANRFVEGKCGVVIGQRAALAIDACNYPDEAQAMADFIREKGRNPDRLALTHGHGDHILGGSAAFAGAEVFAHVATPGVIRKQIPTWARSAGEPGVQVEARLLWPTITFSDELYMDLGGLHVRFFRTPGHSADSACLYVEEVQVLYSSDTAVTGIIPPVGDGNALELEATLRRLAEMPIAALVPGHGPVLQGQERVSAWLRWLADYLGGVRALAREELAHGRDPDAVAAAVSYEQFVGERLPRDQHNMPERHLNTVIKIVAEEVARRGK